MEAEAVVKRVRGTEHAVESLKRVVWAKPLPGTAGCSTTADAPCSRVCPRGYRKREHMTRVRCRSTLASGGSTFNCRSRHSNKLYERDRRAVPSLVRAGCVRVCLG